MKKFIIYDKVTRTYYCTPKRSDSVPFWSSNKKEANKFSTRKMAEVEMQYNIFPSTAEIIEV